MKWVRSFTGFSPSPVNTTYSPAASTVCASVVLPGLASTSKTIEPKAEDLLGSPWDFLLLANASTSASVTPGLSWNRITEASLTPVSLTATLTAPDSSEPPTVAEPGVIATVTFGSGVARARAGAIRQPTSRAAGSVQRIRTRLRISDMCAPLEWFSGLAKTAPQRPALPCARNDTPHRKAPLERGFPLAGR